MKTLKIYTLITILGLIPYIANSQFKTQTSEPTSVVNTFYKPTPYPSILGWFSPQNFRMNHNFSLQYFAGANGANSIAAYTNSMFYQFTNNLNARLDISLMGSPFGDYRNNLNKLFISRAEINYRPWENFHLQLQYRQLPASYYGYYMPYHWYTSPFYFDEK